MDRLVDGKDSEPTLEKAREVLALARPPAVTRARMQRVRWAIDRRARSTPLVTLPLLVGAAFLLLGASALAAFGGGLLGDRTEQEPKPSVVVSSQKPRFATPPAVALEKPATPAAAPAVAPLDPVPQKERHAPAARASAEANADVERVHNAAAALRREGDPAKAAKLLESIDSHKAGPLAEEALALRIEAAMSQHDPRARDFAATYLSRYPAGRYAAVAREALRSNQR